MQHENVQTMGMSKEPVQLPKMYLHIRENFKKKQHKNKSGDKIFAPTFLQGTHISFTTSGTIKYGISKKNDINRANVLVCKKDKNNITTKT